MEKSIITKFAAIYVSVCFCLSWDDFIVRSPAWFALFFGPPAGAPQKTPQPQEWWAQPSPGHVV